MSDESVKAFNATLARIEREGNAGASDPFPAQRFGIVQISARKLYIVQGGMIGDVPLWYARPGEPTYSSLEKAVARYLELIGEAPDTE